MLAERAGDGRAYEGFLKELALVLRPVVGLNFRRFGLSPAETEDVVQEVLIAVHARRGQWDETRPLLPWLHAITRYKTIDAVRRLRRDARGRVDLSDVEWSRLFAAERADPERNSRDLEIALAELPAGQRSVVQAIGLDGASPREAAARLGSSEGAVRVAFHRSLKKLMAAAQRRLQG